MRAKLNEDAWLKVPLWALLGYVVLLGCVVPRSGGIRGTTAGWLLLPAIIGTGLVVFLATRSSSRWGWRSYAVLAPSTILVIAVGLALVQQSATATVSGDPVNAGPQSLADLESGAAEVSAQADAAPVQPFEIVETPLPAVGSSPLLTLPGDGHGWTRAASPQDLAADETLSLWTQRVYGVLDVVAGSYVNAAAPGSVVRYVAVNDTIAGATPRAVGRAFLGSVIGSKTYDFPARADGYLGCNATSIEGEPQMRCAWIGKDRAVFMRWVETDITIGRAARLTRSLRDHASS